MILNIIFSIIGIVLYTYLGVYIYQNLIDNKRMEQNMTVFFYVMYFILFIILINIIIITMCHSKLIKQTGPSGPVGFRGDRGKQGYNGECNSNCYKIELKMELINNIQDIYNTLLTTDNKNNIDITLHIKESKTDKLVDIKLKNNLLNNIVDSIVYSKQYEDAVKSKKTIIEVNSYIKSVIKKWITLIYISLDDSKYSLDKNENFFLDKFGSNNNTTWKNDENPFEKIQKYDLYDWGRSRVFKPLNIYIDNNPTTSNYLPQDGQPPLKLLHTNHYRFLYENTNIDSKDPKIKNIINKYPKNTGSIWKNNNTLKYRKENYYPVGDLIIGPDNNYSPTISNAYVKDPEFNEKYEFPIIQSNDNIAKFKKKHKGRRVKGTNCRNIIRKVKWDLDGGYLRNKYKTERVIICPKDEKLSFKTPRKETILVTGDVADPEDYEELWDNSNSYEKTNIKIWRPKCPYGYESLSDIATEASKDPKDYNLKCVPKDCITENKNDMKTILKTHDNKEIQSYSDKDDSLKATDDNSYNFFRLKTKDQKPLYIIKDQCKNIAKTKVKKVEDRYRKLGYGWHGRSVRNPKYSIFSYLVQMPEAIISCKDTNYKYYIIHTDLYNSDNNPDANLKTSAKNLYYILTLNYNNYKYDRCFSTFGTGDSDEIIRTRIRSEDESYWEIEPITNNDGSPNYEEIRLKSKKTNKYFKHNRKDNLRRDLVQNKVYEKQVPLDKNDESLIFVNIKSAFGTNVKAALENGNARLEDKYYLNNDENIINNSKKYDYKNRGRK